MKRKSPPADRPDSVRRGGWAGLLVVAALLAPVAPPAIAGEVEAFIRDTADRVFTSYAGDITDERRKKVFREALTGSFGLKTIARFTLGRYWRVASSDQRKEYRRLFEDFLVLAYANRFRDLGGVKLRVTSVRMINKRDQLVLSEVDLWRRTAAHPDRLAGAGDQARAPHRRRDRRRNQYERHPARPVCRRDPLFQRQGRWIAGDAARKDRAAAIARERGRAARVTPATAACT